MGGWVVMSGSEFEPPKYAKVVLGIREKIESGEYPAGSMLPSETALVREYAAGRSTVVRALQMLQQDGWITREHGRGSFVRGRPDAHAKGSRPGLAVLDQPEVGERVRLVAVGQVAVPAPVASVLGVDAGERLVMRRWVNLREGLAAELVTCWFPVELTQGTDLGRYEPLLVGVREHIRAIKNTRADHITERLTARLASTEEASALEIAPTDPVIAIIASVHDPADVVRWVVEVVLPGSLHELEDVYSVPE
jgi:GntR family transcriptional regulator